MPIKCLFTKQNMGVVEIDIAEIETPMTFLSCPKMPEQPQAESFGDSLLNKSMGPMAFGPDLFLSVRLLPKPGCKGIGVRQMSLKMLILYHK